MKPINMLMPLAYTNSRQRCVARLQPMLRWLLFAMLVLSLLQGTLLYAEDAVAHAVLFYSPSCGHCHKVMTEDLPPLMEMYGAQLDIVAVNTAHPDGQVLYQAAIEHFKVPPERRGVPTLIIGETILVGSLEIPQQLPILVDAYLEEGGIGWPEVPGFSEALGAAQLQEEASEPEPTSVPGPPTPYSAQPDTSPPVVPDAPVSDPPPDDAIAGGPDAPLQRSVSNVETNTFVSRFRQDVTGNTLSLFVLIGMVGAVIIVPLRLRQPIRALNQRPTGLAIASWAMPLLFLIGLSVSAYMAYVETTLSPAICGPVGDCNAVQQSSYARLFGLVPIGIVGIAGYGALAIVWFLQRNRTDPQARQMRLLLFAMALLGALFSIYLTFLEPFVIGATCLWCLTSAITMTLIFLFSGLLLQSPPRAIGDGSENHSQGSTFIIEGTNENRRNH